MTIDEVVQMLNASLPSHLTPLQEWLLRQAWEGKTYTNMAAEANYVEEYLRRTASGLWSTLSDFWGESITKTNFRSILESRQLSQVQQQLLEDLTTSTASTPPEFPGSPVSLDSRFYIPRPPIEKLAYEEISKPGSVTRIKAASKLGKSSLILRIISHAVDLKYCAVTVDFQQADKAVFVNIDKFLRWFGANVARSLQLESKLDDYWDEEIGSKVSCSIYFQAYLLQRIPSPLVLVLNEVNRVFEYPEIAQDFLPLLRFWHEQARKEDIWQKLRLVVAYSTEIYIPLKLNQSPFNVGLPLKLPMFTKAQVLTLAQRYGLSWMDESKVKRLMAVVGGHPYLLQVALYQLYWQKITLKQLLDEAVTETGIYNDHLRRLLLALQEEEKLEAAFKQVISADRPVKLEPLLAHKLDSMGLVIIDGDLVTPSCELYRLYFKKQLLLKDESIAQSDETNGNASREHLEKENLQPNYMGDKDVFTGLVNRRYFNDYLQREWKRSVRDRTFLSLILCDIDFFKAYNDAYGVIAGDNCLLQVANAINSCVKRPADLVARYGDEEFAVILPSTDSTGAIYVAEKIRQAVKALAIPHKNTKIASLPNNVVTVSLGVATTIADLDNDVVNLVRAADLALDRAITKGRDRVTLQSIENA